MQNSNANTLMVLNSRQRPIWFEISPLVKENREHPFVVRLENLIKAVQHDLIEREKFSTKDPNNAKKKFYFNSLAGLNARFNFREMSKQVTTFNGQVHDVASFMVQNFRQEFHEYIPFLEEAKEVN